MKEIGLALHNYRDVYDTFPPSGVFAELSVAVAESPVVAAKPPVSEPEPSPFERFRTPVGPVPRPDQFDSFHEFAEAREELQPKKEPFRIRSVLTEVSMEESTSAVELVGHHGWMTSLLPYLDEMSLYDKVNFNIPWADPRNAEAFQTTVDTYLSASPHAERDKSGHGGYAVAHYAANSRLLRPNSVANTPSSNSPGGWANTILLGQVTVGIQPWGSPDNSRDPAAGIAATDSQFSGPSAGVVQYLMCDGSVQTLANTVDPEVLERLAGKEQADIFGF